MNVRARESFRVCRGVFWSSLLKVGEVALVLLNQILRFLSWRLCHGNPAMFMCQPNLQGTALVRAAYPTIYV
ncbi:protein of unknown function [Methylotuvimicrobium alcaliphilum 20Z]|uniref:Uncharacterized protein n=1 Tax=Methylotuvimicrobium alcaliphilum (strain DSM 19304 / NCIMB 14124 / VKM B-2133 / 20Z) TaxID=1091494 RepID=G4SYK9_META2|nr:protein of unknown function [Methylotuvimicrobium alcaliphilum 20Z]